MESQYKSFSKINDIAFGDTLHGICAGDYGTVAITTDDGTHWLYSKTGTEQNLRKILFWNGSHADILGDSLLLVTANGGAEWQRIAIPTLTTLNDGWSDGAASIWAVGDSGAILSSNDSGKKWQTHDAHSLVNFRKVIFLNSDTGIIVGDASTEIYYGDSTAIFRTTNGGIEWNETYITGVPYNTSLAYHSNHILLLASATLYESYDAGATWQYSAYNAAAGEGVSNISWPDSDHLFLESGEQIERYFYTKLRGIYQEQGVFSRVSNTLMFQDSVHGWRSIIGGAGANFLAQSTDGGITWRESPGDRLLNIVSSIQYTSGDSAWAFTIGAFPGLYRSADSGATWRNIVRSTGYNIYLYSPTPASSYPAELEMVNGRQGWVNDSSVLYSTDDGWQTKHALLDSISNFYFLDSLHGIAFQDEAILRTNNGGASWDTILAKSADAFSIVDSMHLWLIADYFTEPGTMYATKDGGKSWDTIDIAIQLTVSSPLIQFLDPLRGYLLSRVIGGGVPDTLWATADGGKTWVYRGVVSDNVQNPNATIAGFRFYDLYNGWVYGSAGSPVPLPFIWRTRDGGSTWSEENIEPYPGTVVTTMQINDLNHLWAAGTGGAVWRWDSINTSVHQPYAQYIRPSTYRIYTFPNPFAVSTHITFAAAGARVSVADMLGRTVAVLRSGGAGEYIWQPAPGAPSGTYFVVVKTTAGVVSKPVMLLR